MLRSRGNRQQRPSESSDERGGDSDPRHGPQLPSRGGSDRRRPAIRLPSGADEDKDFYAPSKPKVKPQAGRPQPGLGRSRSVGYMGSPLGSGRKALPRTGSGPFPPASGGRGRRDARERKKMILPVVAPPKRRGVALVMSLVLLASAAVAGLAAAHYRAAVAGLEEELAVLNSRRTESRIGTDDGSEDGERSVVVTTEEMEGLHAEKASLEGEAALWKKRKTEQEKQVISILQFESLQSDEVEGHAVRVADMRAEMERERSKGRGYKEKFVETLRSGSGGIVPGGPGHLVVLAEVVERMETLEDYEGYVKQREDALWKKIDRLVEKIQEEARRETLEWFGPGPHRVELEIEHPEPAQGQDPSAWPRIRSVLEIEMAPLDVMPTAVHLFLQQVHHRLWEGCSFFINAGHILQAGPHRLAEGGGYDANQRDLLGRFQRSRLDKMPFQEYHTDYPHTQYTLGYAGRPGGPDFYVNKADNSAIHGPGGQDQHDLHEEADPAFGMLVGGVEVIEALDRVPIDWERGSTLVHSVMIMDSRVVSLRGEAEQDEGTEEGDGVEVRTPAMGPAPNR